MKLSHLVAGATLVAGTSAVAAAQGVAARLMTSADLPSLTAPPPDHRIQYGPGPLQFGNLRLPKRAGPHPVVVLIHGGCWLSQYDIAHLAALEQAIADSGFAVWSLEYRRVGDAGGGWPGTFTDIARGADYLRVLAPRYALDLTRVVASGHSAGGQLALWLAARKKIPVASELYTRDPLAVRAVFALAPAPDLEGLHASGVCGNVIDRLMGGSPADHPDRYAAASPMRLAPIAVPQVLVIGARDQSWGPIGRSYFARARAAGDTTVRLVEAPESGHFEMIAPATTSWRVVIGALKALTRSSRRPIQLSRKPMRRPFIVRSVLFLAASATLVSAPLSAQATPSVELRGPAGQRRTLSIADLARLPRREVKASAHAVSGTFSGVSLADVVQLVGAPIGDSLRGPALASYVLVEAADGYRVTFTLAEFNTGFTDRLILVADRKDGAALSTRDGPFQLVVADEKRPARWVRQVTRISVVLVPPSG